VYYYTNTVLRIDPSDATPIWSQIEEGLRRLVAAGALTPGAPVPSVRDLAKDLRINPATVAKAYQRLTDAGILMVRRGEGTYVADTPPPISRAERSRTLRDGATRYASLAATLGVTPAESAEALETAWRSLDPKKGARS
jgi:GntR family transcriptional regulator